MLRAKSSGCDLLGVRRARSFVLALKRLGIDDITLRHTPLLASSTLQLGKKFFKLHVSGQHFELFVPI